MLSKAFFQVKVLLHLIILILPLSIKANQVKDSEKYFFTMYPSKGSQTPYIVHAYTPSSKHLIIDYSIRIYVTNCCSNGSKSISST